MNRTIKFRGKRIDNGQWVYGWLLGDKQTFIVSNFIVDRFVRPDMKCPNLAISDIYEVDPKTVGEFTGLLDSVKNEIYEDDILMLDCDCEDHYGLPEACCKDVVIFDDAKFSTNDSTQDFVDEIFYSVVIGNRKHAR